MKDTTILLHNNHHRHESCQLLRCVSGILQFLNGAPKILTSGARRCYNSLTSN
jgi:hypothetical protein